MTKVVKIICTDSDETMIHWPDGRVEFVGFWELLCLMWRLVRNRWGIEVLDGRSKP